MHTRLYKNKNSGFTLIELLVVIAIIGILSSVVLASINTARTKARDSSIVASLKNMMPQAELYLDSNGSFTNLCTDPGMVKIIASIDNSVSTARCYVRSGGKGWAVSAAAKSDNKKNWSVDSLGVVAWDTTDPLSGVNLNWNSGVTACKNLGGRLPSMEQIIALSMIYNGPPPGFQSGGGMYYWSGISDENDDTKAYLANVLPAVIAVEDSPTTIKTNTSPHARCVR